jgi:hypothetical protein
MSDDIVERLRSPEKVVIPAGAEMMFIHSTSQWPHTLFPVMVCGGTGGTMRNLEPFSVSISSSERLEAAAEIERLRARVEVLECVLRDARHNGLIYWEPRTTRGAVQRANMMSRIDFVLNKEAKP